MIKLWWIQSESVISVDFPTCALLDHWSAHANPSLAAHKHVNECLRPWLPTTLFLWHTRSNNWTLYPCTSAFHGLLGALCYTSHLLITCLIIVFYYWFYRNFDVRKLICKARTELITLSHLIMFQKYLITPLRT